MENAAFAAWQSHDPNFWQSFVADNFVGYTASGKVDKAAAVRGHASTHCTLHTFALSDARVHPIGTNAALLTYLATEDGACDQYPFPTALREATIYIRHNDTWQAISHAENAIVDPKTMPTPPASTPSAATPIKPSATDANTQALLAVERPFWEAWRTHNAHKLAALMAPDASFINLYGTYFPTKTDALKDWTSTACNISAVSVSNATSTMLSPTAGILTFTGTAIGTCYGQPLHSTIGGTSLYVKTGNTWKWTFGINVLLRP
jgi:ketosteroid isomerase-like protein